MRAFLYAAALLVTSSLLIQPLDAQRSRGKSDPDRLICKASEKTGSLVQRERQCFTRAEWERLFESGNKSARDLRERQAGACGVNGGLCPLSGY